MLSNMKDPRWWGQRLIELAAAVALFYMSVALIEYREAVSKANVPAEDWFVVNEIYVPDHPVGSNPNMVYDRTILVGHRGFWIAEAQRISPDGREGLFENACTGSGVDDYDPSDVLGPDSTVDWTWFFGRPCVVPPGAYRIQLTRDMTKPGYPVKQDQNFSNTFHVLPVK